MSRRTSKFIVQKEEKQLPRLYASWEYTRQLLDVRRMVEAFGTAVPGLKDGKSPYDEFDKTDEWDLDPGRRIRLQRICRSLFLKNDIARHACSMYAQFVLGNGITIDFEDDYSAEARWNVVERRNNLSVKIAECILNTFILGEWFFVLYEKTGFGVMDVRPIDPGDIVEIEYQDNDPEMPITYLREFQNGNLMRYPSSDIMHFKINSLGVGLRGRPLLEAVIPRILDYENFLQLRIAVEDMRTRLPIIRKVKRGAKSLKDSKFKDLPPKYGILTVPVEEDWIFPSLNASSSEANEDGMSILNSIARGLSIPSWMLTQDYSRANFASSLLSEAGPFKLFKFYGEQFRPVFEKLVKRICEYVSPGKHFQVMMDEPSLLSLEKRTDIWLRIYQGGGCSKRTLQERLNLDPEREAKRMMDEMAGDMAGPVPGLGLTGLGGLGGTQFPSLGGGLAIPPTEFFPSTGAAPVPASAPVATPELPAPAPAPETAAPPTAVAPTTR